jgi:hypothetical protein
MTLLLGARQSIMVGTYGGAKLLTTFIVRKPK